MTSGQQLYRFYIAHFELCVADGEFANKFFRRLGRALQKNTSKIRPLINLVYFFESVYFFLIKNSFYSIHYGRGSLSTMLASMSRLQPSFHFIHFPWHTGTRSILPCVLPEQKRGRDLRDGCKAPMLLFWAARRGDHSCIRNATSNDATHLVRTPYRPIKGAHMGN